MINKIIPIININQIINNKLINIMIKIRNKIAHRITTKQNKIKLILNKIIKIKNVMILN